MEPEALTHQLFERRDRAEGRVDEQARIANETVEPLTQRVDFGVEALVIRVVLVREIQDVGGVHSAQGATARGGQAQQRREPVKDLLVTDR